MQPFLAHPGQRRTSCAAIVNFRCSTNKSAAGCARQTVAEFYCQWVYNIYIYIYLDGYISRASVGNAFNWFSLGFGSIDFGLNWKTE